MIPTAVSPITKTRLLKSSDVELSKVLIRTPTKINSIMNTTNAFNINRIISCNQSQQNRTVCRYCHRWRE